MVKIHLRILYSQWNKSRDDIDIHHIVSLCQDGMYEFCYELFEIVCTYKGQKRGWDLRKLNPEPANDQVDKYIKLSTFVKQFLGGMSYVNELRNYIRANSAALCSDLIIGDVPNLIDAICNVKLYIIITGDNLIIYSDSTKITLSKRIALHGHSSEQNIRNAIRSNFYFVTVVGILPGNYKLDAMQEKLLQIENVHNKFLKCYVKKWNSRVSVVNTAVLRYNAV